jgi:hypothetical protein
MNLTLERETFNATGIFGKLYDESGTQIAVTLEHAYEQPIPNMGYFGPKLPYGDYKCVRGFHQLAHMAVPFLTFEVTGVPGHTGILFHCGNDNADSAGCILLGLIHEGAFILESRDAFNKFMAIQEDVSDFTLTVK